MRAKERLAIVVTIEEQIACVERELGFRKKLYPRWVGSGKLTAENAQQELDRMEAVLVSLQRVQKRLDAVIPDAKDIRAGAEARVLCTLAPMVHTDVYLRLQRKLREMNT